MYIQEFRWTQNMNATQNSNAYAFSITVYYRKKLNVQLWVLCLNSGLLCLPVCTINNIVSWIFHCTLSHIKHFFRVNISCKKRCGMLKHRYVYISTRWSPSSCRDNEGSNCFVLARWHWATVYTLWAYACDAWKWQLIKLTNHRNEHLFIQFTYVMAFISS